jgi:PASTA domain/IPT/TIG domain
MTVGGPLSTLRKFLSISAATAAVVMTTSAVAEAQITLGQLAPPNPPAICVNGPFDLAQSSVVGNGYSVPAPGGVITSWSTNAAAGAGQTLSFKVYRPQVPNEKFLVVGVDGPHDLTASALNTFKTSIHVQAGDIVGDNDLNASTVPNACLFETGDSSDTVGEAGGDVGTGGTFTQGVTQSELRVNVTATLLPPPAISGESPAAGPVGGGTVVTLTGANFAEVSGVSFGALPAQSFVVNSEAQITAIAPASAVLGAVPIYVGTVAGTATAPTSFVYEGCAVPKLKGRKLKAAKKKLRAAGCKIGKVKKRKGATAKTGKVVKQNPKPGRILAPGTAVKVVLKGHPRHKRHH